MSVTTTVGEVLAAADELSAAEQKLLELEAKIENARLAFVEAGEALDRIRVLRLFHPQYETFDAYCRERWGFTRARASQLIRGAFAVTSGIAPSATTERQARGQARIWRGQNREELSFEMHEAVAELRCPTAPDDVPAGVRLPLVGKPVYQLFVHDANALRDFRAGVGVAELNQRERAYLRAALDVTEAQIKERAREIRRLLR